MCAQSYQVFFHKHTRTRYPKDIARIPRMDDSLCNVRIRVLLALDTLQILLLNEGIDSLFNVGHLGVESVSYTHL